MEDNREMLLKRVQICDFILVETNEYLDTHPTTKRHWTILKVQ